MSATGEGRRNGPAERPETDGRSLPAERSVTTGQAPDPGPSMPAGSATGVRATEARSGYAAVPPTDGQAVGGPWARWKARTTGGAPLFPLGALFGLNMVDELDRAAFTVLLPEIRDHFGLDNTGILTVQTVSLVLALLLSVPVGFYSDRLRRTRIAAAGATIWGFFSALTAFAPNVGTLGAARAGTSVGRLVNEPVHNSLLADYYDVPVRPRVYALHRGASPVGQLVGPVAAGLLGFYLGWRVPFVVFTVVTATFVVMALRLREPVRGRFERKAAGASDEVVDAEEASPSWAEAWRILWQVRTVRRIYYSVPLVALLVIGHPALMALYLEDVFGMDERARGFLGALGMVGAIAGLLVGGAVSSKLLARDAGLVLKLGAVAAVVVGAANVLLALAPTEWVLVVALLIFAAGSWILTPGIYAVLSLVLPAKVRSFGYGSLWLWAVPGLLLVPAFGALGEAHGLRIGLLAMTPVIVLFGLVTAFAGNYVQRDADYVWRSGAARAEIAEGRRQGRIKLLLARGIDVHYDGVQVLFGVDLEVGEGEVVALLGTNGAGKSTLLRAMSGLVQPSGGVVFFDGRDLTHTPPDEVAGRGITQVPGGQGVFTQLSVGDNLRLAGWLQRRDPAPVKAATERVVEIFPVLRERWHEPAGNLSGGQQQMLTLGMAFIGKPRMLFIDELSLGLAPTVIAQLLTMVRELRNQGVTIILVEQSVNVALTVAERAYFMEKGEIRFQGPTRELLERPDLLRSVFFSSAAGAVLSPQNGPATPTGPVAAPSGVEGNGARPEGAAATRPEPTAVARWSDGAGAARPEESPKAASGAAAAGDTTGDPPAEGRTEPPVLEVRGVTKDFGGVRALHGVSFDVRPQEILGFIGPNGAGKTTLFDVISGFVPAERGSVGLRVDDAVVDLQHLSTHRRARQGLGRSFQDGRLFPGLTVAETLAVALDQHVEARDPIAASLRLPSVRDAEEQVRLAVDELVELLGLGAYRDKFVRELSTGTRRIVDLACVLAHGPRVVLLDEPSSGIAQREAEALAPVLRRVQRELGAALLVIEHDLPLLLSIADRMVALELGRVVTVGDPQEVVDHPAVVASYLGTDEAAVARSGAAAPG